MRSIIRIVLVFLSLLVSSVAFSAEYDFYIDFSECKNVVGYLVLSKESLTIIPGDPTVLACTRRSNIVLCDFVFKDDLNKKGLQGNAEQYKVVIDSPPFLHFKSETGAEYIAIDTSQHAAILSSRMLHEKFLGAKVCQGLFTTDFEIKNLDKK